MTSAERDSLANLLPNHSIDSTLLVHRGTLPEELMTDILTANSVKLLVAGQRGMGKTVELRRLETILKQNDGYEPIFLQFGAEENIDDVNLVYTMARALVATGKISEKRGGIVSQWFDKEELVSSYTEKIGGESGINANALFVRAKVGIESQRLNKKSSTTVVVKQKRGLITAFNELIAEFSKSSKKQAVFIVDDIDKIQDLGSVEATFVNSAQLIGNIDAPCVFTVPFTYATSSFIRMASLPYENIHRVPAVAIVDAHGQKSAANTQFLVQLLKKRLLVDTFTDLHLEKIVEYSGGVIVDALRLTRGTLRQKIVNAEEEVGTLIEHEFQKIVDEYCFQVDKPILWQKIRKFYSSEDPTVFLADDATVDLVCKMILIEYRQHSMWHRLHPAVRRLYEQNREQIESQLAQQRVE